MARPKLGDSESKRLQMIITEDELKVIEDWQFENRVPSKSEAIRRLVQIGLICNQPIITAADAVDDIYEKARSYHNDLVASQKLSIKKDDDSSALAYNHAINEIRPIFELLELAQLLVRRASNQVDEISDTDAQIEEGMKSVRDWRERAEKHLRLVKRRHSRRAKE